MKVFGESETMTANFERTDSFLECLLVIFAKAHRLADSAHLCAEFVFNAFELFKGPSGELDHDIIAGRCVFFERSIPPVRYLVERKASSEQ